MCTCSQVPPDGWSCKYCICCWLPLADWGLSIKLIYSRLCAWSMTLADTEHIPYSLYSRIMNKTYTNHLDYFTPKFVENILLPNIYVSIHERREKKFSRMLTPLIELNIENASPVTKSLRFR